MTWISGAATYMAETRQAARALARRPAYPLVAVGTLALAAGAAGAIFSAVHGVLLKPLPYPQPERVMMLLEDHREEGLSTVSPPNFLDWRSRSHSFSAMAAFQRGNAVFAGDREPELVAGMLATGDFFRVLGVAPLIGRTFGEADAAMGAEPVVVLAHDFWRRRFGGDAGLVGRTVQLDGEPHRVVAVMPEQFRFSTPARAEPQFWVPLSFPADVDTQRGAHYLGVVGRLESGTDLKAAATELKSIGADLEREYPRTNAGVGISVEPLSERLVGRVRPGLRLAMGAVLLVMLVACANLAILALALAAARARELAVRAALGAGVLRIARQILAENLLVGVAAAAAALPTAWGFAAGLKAWAPAQLPRVEAIGFEWPVLLFILGGALLAALGCGLVPALLIARSDVARRLGAGGLSGERGAALRGALVVGELALAVMLLAGSGLLAKSFLGITAQDPGFDADGALSFEVPLPADRYPGAAQQAAFTERALDALRASPEVAEAGAVMGLPMSGFSFSGSFAVDGVPEGDSPPSAEVRLASPGYFEALGIPLVAGRGFNAADRPGAPRVALVTAAAAKRFWPAGDALGRRVRFGARPSKDVEMEGEIVGIVGDIRDSSLDVATEPLFYLPLAQTGVDQVGFVVRPPAGRGGAALVAAVRRTLSELDPGIPLVSVRPVAKLIENSVAPRRFWMILMALFALTGVVLAAVGVYAVTTQAVGRRVREIGLRKALGAGNGRLLAETLGRASRALAAGLVLGLTGALGAGRLLSGFLVEVSPRDPWVLLGVMASLAVAGLAAAWAPARRAARVDPMTALRAE